jgi:hypothetical protein
VVCSNAFSPLRILYKSLLNLNTAWNRTDSRAEIDSEGLSTRKNPRTPSDFFEKIPKNPKKSQKIKKIKNPKNP